jgi:hypothetical protein
MYSKKLKRRCSVRGCKCTDTYAISLTREVGNSVIICPACLEKANEAVKNAPAEPEVKASAGAPSLFFNASALGTVSDETPEPAVDDVTADDVTDDGVTADDGEPDATESASEFACPYCGQVCKTELGLQKHIKAKHEGEVK